MADAEIKSKENSQQHGQEYMSKILKPRSEITVKLLKVSGDLETRLLSETELAL